MDEISARCELCDRPVAALTAHHLTPRLKTRRKGLPPSTTIMICGACHRQLHTLFTHTELANDLASVEQLQAEPRMAAFLTWVRKQDPARKVKVRRRRR